jgi:hypothetical protein
VTTGWWVGKDEHGGVPSEVRSDREQPPHWRFDAIYATARPHHLSMSPRGDVVGFVLDTDGTNDLWVMPASGGPLRRLTTGRGPVAYWEDGESVWSPSGDRLAYGNDGFVEVVAVAGGTPRRRRRWLPSSSAEEWSPPRSTRPASWTGDVTVFDREGMPVLTAAMGSGTTNENVVWDPVAAAVTFLDPTTGSPLMSVTQAEWIEGLETQPPFPEPEQETPESALIFSNDGERWSVTSSEWLDAMNYYGQPSMLVEDDRVVAVGFAIADGTTADITIWEGTLP